MELLLIRAPDKATSTNRSHISDNNSNEENKEDIKCAEDEVAVCISNKTKVFKVNTLKKLPYFEAMLSKRWNTNNEDKKVDSDDDNNDRSNKNDNNNSRPINLFDNVDDALFGLQQLELLLKCIELRHIPYDITLSLNELDLLAKCSDFFCISSNQNQSNNSTAVINKNKLIKYFQLRKPPLTINERKKGLIDCNNNIIRESLTEYNDILSKQLNMTRNNVLLSSISSLKYNNNGKESTINIKNCNYDSHTAAQLFKNKFKIIFGKTIRNQITIKINEFDRQLWNHLSKLFHIYEHWYYFSDYISNIIENLLILPDIVPNQNQNQNQGQHRNNEKIICADEEVVAIDELLDKIGGYFVPFRIGDLLFINPDCKTNPNISSNITMYSILVSRFNLYHGKTFVLKDMYSECYTYIQYMICNITNENNDLEKFLKIYIKTIKLYENNFNTRNDGNSEQSTKSFRSWYKLFLEILKHCSDTFLVSNAKLWFPIVYDGSTKYNNVFSKSKWNKIIFKHVISKFGTQQAFNFGLYLMDFIMNRNQCSNDNNGNNGHGNNENSGDTIIGLDKKFVEFIQENVGISL